LPLPRQRNADYDGRRAGARPAPTAPKERRNREDSVVTREDCVLDVVVWSIGAGGHKARPYGTHCPGSVKALLGFAGLETEVLVKRAVLVLALTVSSFTLAGVFYAADAPAIPPEVRRVAVDLREKAFAGTRAADWVRGLTDEVDGMAKRERSHQGAETDALGLSSQVGQCHGSG